MDLMPDKTFIFQWIIFILAFATLHFGIFRPVLGIIAARKEATDGRDVKRTALEQKTGEMGRELEGKISEGKKEGARTMQKLRQEGEIEASRMIQEVRARIETKLQNVRQVLGRESRNAEVELKGYAKALSSDIAGRILGRPI